MIPAYSCFKKKTLIEIDYIYIYGKIHRTKLSAYFFGLISILIHGHKLYYICKAISLFQKPKGFQFWILFPGFLSLEANVRMKYHNFPKLKEHFFFLFRGKDIFRLYTMKVRPTIHGHIYISKEKKFWSCEPCSFAGFPLFCIEYNHYAKMARN